MRINYCKQKYFFYKKAKIRDELLSLLCSLAQMCLGHIYVQMYKTYFPETYDGILYHLYMYMYVVIVDNLIDSVNWPKFQWIWPKCHALVSLILLLPYLLRKWLLYVNEYHCHGDLYVMFDLHAGQYIL